MPSALLAPRLDTSAKIALSFPLSPGLSRLRVSSLEITQEANAHDIFRVTVSGTDPEFVRPYLPAGSPFRLSVSTTGGSEVFHGYVHRVEQEYDLLAKETTITAVSCGYPMKARGQKNFANVTADTVVRYYADKHRLNPIIEPHRRRFNQLVQSGESDWEFLREMAERTGHSLRVEGVNLRFVSKAALSRHYRSLSPTLSYARNRGGFLFHVLRFEPVESAYNNEDSVVSARHRVAYLDGLAGSYAAATSSTPSDPAAARRDPVYTRFTAETAKTFREAALIAAAQSENARYAYVADAAVVGNPTIAPDRTVYLRGVPAKYAGYWTVLRARHHIIPGKGYSLDLHLGSEGDLADRHGLSAGPGSPRASQYRFGSGTTSPRLVPGNVRTGRSAILIPDFFADGPRWAR